MFLRLVALALISMSTWSFSAPKNQEFNNLRVYQDLQTQRLGVTEDVFIGGDTTIGGNLVVDGTISGGGGSGFVVGPATSTINAVAVFANTTGSQIKETPVLIDGAGNVSNVNDIELNTITNSGNTVAWPALVGAPGTFLGITAPGQLGYTTPAGSGNVSAAANFTVPDNKIVLTDLASGSKNVKQSTSVVIDASDNISGVNSLTANTVNANINGTASLANNTLNVGTKTALQVQNATTDVQNATNAPTLNTIVKRDNVDGSFSIGSGTMTGNITGNAGTATTAGFATNATTAVNFSGSLAGNVTGPQTNTVVQSVGGQTATAVATAATAVAAAVSAPATSSTLVVRDLTGSFTGGTITASTGFVGSLSGNASSATLANNTSNVGSQTAAQVQAATIAANAASTTTPGTIVLRDAFGNFTANVITANLNGNATSATSAISTLTATYALNVGTKTAAQVDAATTLANAASITTPGTIVLRDVSGNFTANVITAALNGNANTATTAVTATNFSGSLSGQVTGPQTATVVSFVGTTPAATVETGVAAANAATNANSPGNIILRSPVTSDFSIGTGTMTGNISGNAGTATTAGFATNANTAVNFSGSLAGNVTGPQTSTVVQFVGGQSAANVASATAAVLAATSSSPAPGTLVMRDGITSSFSGETITANVGFSGNLTGNVTGNVTGNLFGNATSATSSDTATWFSQPLTGDVTGPQTATHVAFVGNKTFTQVQTSVDDTIAATPLDVANTIVKRNGSNNFATNMITIDGTVTNPHDTATKEYVDTAVTTGIVPKTPVVVTSIINTTTAGLGTPIDGVTLSANDRVLLTAETNQIYNGIWLAESGPWTRPTDFANGTQAGGAYVLTSSGLTLAGSSWLCNTPLAFIGTNTVNFVEFTTPGQTTGANVGTGVGQVFRDKTGITLNFKTLAEGPFIDITNGANELTIAVTATSDNTPNTVVSRDAFGNFYANNITANLTGAASANVLKTGDTMSGNLTMQNGSEVRWAKDTGANYIGFKAPTTGSFGYTVALPGFAPSAGQFLQALDASSLTWTTVGGVPAETETIYVALNGNNLNNGSLSAPLRTVKAAVTKANTLSTLTTPVTISIGAGVFVEAVSGGSLAITAEGITIEGSSISSTILLSDSTTIPFFTSTTANVMFSNLTLRTIPVGSVTSAISITTNAFGRARFSSVGISTFGTGISINSSTGLPFSFIENLQCTDNTTCLSINNAQVAMRTNLFQGSSAGSPANTGMVITGTTSQIATFNSYFSLFNNAISISDKASQRILGCNFENTINAIQCSGASKSQIIGTNFILNFPTSINVAASGASTLAYLEGCLFDCEDTHKVSQGTAVQCTDQAEILVGACTIEQAIVGIACGTPLNTNTTKIIASGLNIVNTTTSIQQRGTSSLQFVGGSMDELTLDIANPLNVDIAGFNADGEAHLAIGKTSDTQSIVYQILNAQASLPSLNYEPNYYGYKGTVYTNDNNNPTFNGTQAKLNNAAYCVVTQDATKNTCLKLISDMANPGSSDNVRGWAITKLGIPADLAFSYTNNDGFPGNNLDYTLMQLSGINNQLQFPTVAGVQPTNATTKLLWGSDTNLYRSAADTLKTDDNFIVGGALSAGSTFISTLTLGAGSPANPSLQFAGSSNTGLSAQTANCLSFDTNGVERMTISPTGTVSIKEFTIAGVVHNNASGQLSSSLIVDADVATNAGITDNKLATISTAGKVANSATTATSASNPNTIVLRDASGNFNAGVISANLIGTVTGNVYGAASLNVLKAGDTMTGILTMSNQNAIRWLDSGINYVGLKAPATVGTSYTVALPANAPLAGQFLQALDASSLTWTTAGGSPTLAESFYVSLDGNDSNNGSFSSPLRHITEALIRANTLSSTNTPVTINVGAGIFVEDNTGGSLQITATGISIVGSSLANTIIEPLDTINFNLFNVTASNVEFSNFSLMSSPASAKSAIKITTTSSGRIRISNVACTSFNKGFEISSTGIPTSVFFENVQFVNNATCIDLTNAQAVIDSCIFRGPLFGPAANSGITVNGATAQAYVFSSYFSLFTTALSVDNLGFLAVFGSNIESSTNSVVATGGSNCQVTGVNFIKNNAASKNITASVSGTIVNVTGCLFQGSTSTPIGTGIQVTTDAVAFVQSSFIGNMTLACAIGTAGDTSATQLRLNGSRIVNNTADIVQTALSRLLLIGTSFDVAKISIANATNVNFSGFNRDSATGNTVFAVGSTKDTEQQVLQALNGQAILPNLSYEPSYYGNKGFIFINKNSNPTCSGVQAQTENAYTFVVTGSNDKETGIKLISDSVTLGNPDNVRGWCIAKKGTTAELAFTFTNNDPGQVNCGPYNLMQLNGFANQLEFPTATGTLPTNQTAKLLWGGDTNLYRPSANTLETDGNFIVGGVLSVGNTFITTLTLAPGTPANPSLRFAGSVGTGLSAQTADRLSLDTNSQERMSISSTGTIAINAFITAGIVHNNNAGQLSSSLIVDADVATNAGIVDTKLATISTAGKVLDSATTATSANIPNTIVERNAFGNFTANVITATLNGNAATATSAITSTSAISFTGQLFGDVTGLQSTTSVAQVGGQSATNVAAGVVLANAATSNLVANTIVRRDASGNFLANIITATLNGNAITATSAITSTSAIYFTGQLFGDVTGLQSTTSVAQVGGQSATNVAAGVVLANAATSNLVANAIVRRDASGNFLANVITATLNGNAATATSAITSTSAIYFTGQLFGDVTGLQSTTSVAQVGGQSATSVATTVTTVNAATSANTPLALVRRDASGNFAAGVITASLIGHASLDLALAGGTMTGTFTAIAGSATVPSIQFVGSTNTGFSAATANTLSFDTLGVERMSIDSTGTVSIPGTLVIAAGTAAQPSLKFSNGTNTGFSSSTANVLSFDTNGVERMSIDSTGTVRIPGTLVVAPGTAAQPSLKFTNGTNTGFSSPIANDISFDVNGIERMSMDASSVTVTAATFIVGTLMAKQSIQVAATSPVTVNPNTSVLILTTATSPMIISNFPLTPVNGQLFTIMLATNAAARSVTMTYSTDPVANNGITPLISTGTNMTASTGGSSATWIYLANATPAGWYKYGR